MIVEIMDLLKKRDRRGGIARFQRIASAQQERIAVARVEREHALQDFFRPAAGTTTAQGFGGC